MKHIIILSSITLALLSVPLSFADIQDTIMGDATSEFTSVRNLPVILENEVLSNNRCRLHLDSGEKIDVFCDQTQK